VSFGSGVRSIDALFEVSSLFRSFLSPASPPLMVITLSFLPSRLSCSIPGDFPPMTSSILISTSHNLTGIVVSFSYYSFGSVSSLLRGWRPSLVCVSRPGIRSVPLVWC